MNYPSLLEGDLRILGVIDAGKPNDERIIIRPNRNVSLAGAGIVVGIDGHEAGAYPLHDNVFWFPGMSVEPPVWLIVYTGSGQFRQTTMNNGEPALVFHWQRPYTIFTSPSLVPVLFQISFSQIGKHYQPKI